ncbi:hypothetical protein F9S82_21270 [Escherichia coli]|nr:hypothetical protein [Escherichia coli]GDK67497.1 conjugal transfer protein TraD [Escherichia coli]
MSFNAKDMTQGGQIASMRIRMFSQIANIMLYCLFIFFWILVGRKRLVRTVLIFTESSDQLSRATDRVPGLPASPGYVQ